jgi:hypothetical protein
MIRRALGLIVAGLAVGCIPALDRSPSTDQGSKPSWDLPVFPQGDALVKGGDADGKAGPGCTVQCKLGCNAAAGRCYRVKPSNLDPSGFHDQVTGKLFAAGAVSIDTETGEIKDGTTVIRAPGNKGGVDGGFYWGVVSQGAGYPDLAVFGMAGLDLPAGAQASVTGKHAVAIYVAGAATIAGTLAVPAAGHKGGPGGFDGGENNAKPGASCQGGEGKGGGTDAAPHNGDGGGGGGGFKAQGGAGADSDYPPKPKGGAAGAANGEETLVPLRGGCGGGAGGGPETGGTTGNGGHGGGGGGAVQIVANGTLEVSGVISAPGAGGEGGHYGAAGGGGGAGGAILLEAAEVKVTGTLAANGGGGGSGSEIFDKPDAPNGQDGQPTATPAAGGKDNGAYGGPGGAGGAGATETGTKPKTDANGGGGGGAVGRIRINAKTTDAASATLSPAAVSVGTKVGVW